MRVRTRCFHSRRWLVLLAVLLLLPGPVAGEELEGADPEEVLKELEAGGGHGLAQANEEDERETEEPEAQEAGLTMLLDVPVRALPAEHSSNWIRSVTDLGLLLPEGEKSGWAIFEVAGLRILVLSGPESLMPRVEVAAENGEWKLLAEEEGKTPRPGPRSFALPAAADKPRRVRVTLEKQVGAAAWLQGVLPETGKINAESAVQPRPMGDPLRWRLVTSLAALEGKAGGVPERGSTTLREGEPGPAGGEMETGSASIPAGSGGNSPGSASIPAGSVPAYAASYSWFVEMRTGPTEDACRQAEWRRPDAARLDLWFAAADRYVQVRFHAEGDLSLLPPRATLGLRENDPFPAFSDSTHRSLGFFPGIEAVGIGSATPSFRMRKLGTMAAAIERGRKLLLEFDEPRQVNLICARIGEGCQRPRELIIEAYDAARARWVPVSILHPAGYCVSVVTFPTVVTYGIRLLASHGIGEIIGFEARSVSAMVSGIASPVFQFHLPGRRDGFIPLMGENEFQVKLASLSDQPFSGVLSVAVLSRKDGKTEVLAATEKPVTVDPRKEASESVIFICDRWAENQSLRLRLQSAETPPRVVETLEYPARAADHVGARLVKPGYRHGVYASQKSDEIEVEGVAAVPVKVLSGRKQLSIRLAVYRKEPGYRIREYRTTDLVSLNTRRYPFKLALSDTPSGHFKLLVTLHAPPVGNQIAKGEDNLYIFPPAPSEVWLDAAGRFRHNGAEFFPLGLMDVPEDEKLFRDLAEAGFNVVHTECPSLSYLKLAGKCGLKVIAGLGTSLRLPQEDKACADGLRALVKPIQDSRHLLGYLAGTDGAGTSPGQPGVAEASPANSASCEVGYRVLFEADPYHPIIQGVGPDDDLETRAAASDILACSVPSIPDAPTRFSHIFEEARLVSSLQNKGVIAHLPLLDEHGLRCLFYAAVASGCRGVLFSRPSWPQAQPLVSEARKLLPFLLGEERAIISRIQTFPFPSGHFISGEGNIVWIVNTLGEKRRLAWRAGLQEGLMLQETITGQAFEHRNGDAEADFGPCEVKVFRESGNAR
ncbi:MAG: hypothetical protein HYU36_06405 [Planctomycetes bacterium]|nr:hypothetical protein [Planctomycetota bacterium]